VKKGVTCEFLWLAPGESTLEKIVCGVQKQPTRASGQESLSEKRGVTRYARAFVQRQKINHGRSGPIGSGVWLGSFFHLVFGMVFRSSVSTFLSRMRKSACAADLGCSVSFKAKSNRAHTRKA